MKKIDYIVLSTVEPTDKNTVWAYPVGNGLVSLRVFNNGSWVSTDQTIDLTPYLKKTDAKNLYLSKTDAQDTYATKTSLSSHTSDDSNPHKVTKSQVGLGNVDNTSDVDKPVSTAVQGALNLKQDKTDNSLETTSKTVVDAINEVKGIADSKQVAGDYATNSALTAGLATKQDTITAGTGLAFEGSTLNVTLDTTVFKVVSVLPDSPAQGDENKIHLVPAEATGANNAYTEYVWVNSAWEILGEYTSEVDLTPYLKTEDAANTYLSKTDASSTYLNKTDASSTYLSKTDASSTYLNKTDAASTYQPAGDYATSTELTEGLAGKQDAGSYATTTQLEALQTEVNSKADSALLPTYTTVPTLTADYNIPANATMVENIYMITIGATVYNVTGDSAIKWAGGVTPTASANSILVVSVLNNLATWQTFI